MDAWLILIFCSGFFISSVLDYFYYSKRNKDTLKKGMEHAYAIGWNAHATHVIKHIDQLIAENKETKE
jgi:hypothetical protein